MKYLKMKRTSLRAARSAKLGDPGISDKYRTAPSKRLSDFVFEEYTNALKLFFVGAIE